MTQKEYREACFNEFYEKKKEYENQEITDSKMFSWLCNTHENIYKAVALLTDTPLKDATLSTVQKFDKLLYSYWIEISEQIHYMNIENLTISTMIENIDGKIKWTVGKYGED